jgi:NAD(P)-dependent dehydrogenase (short-subunit alcohol dehydrogenase family)
MGVQVDVTKAADIAACREVVEKGLAEMGLGGLYALVNNAGTSTAGLVDWLEMEDYRRVMEASVQENWME